jgi:hypothetical protein
VWHRVSRHGIGVVASGRSNSGGRCTSHQRRGRIADKGGGWRERRGRSGCVREGEAARRVTDARAQQHSAARFGLKPNQIYFKRIQICPNFDRSRKVAFPCSKNWKKTWLEKA